MSNLEILKKAIKNADLNPKNFRFRKSPRSKSVYGNNNILSIRISDHEYPGGDYSFNGIDYLLSNFNTYDEEIINLSNEINR